MKLILIDLARTIWLFDTQQLNPTGASLTATMKDFIGRYTFKKFPKSVLDLNDKQGLSFEEGEFRTSDGRTINVTFTFYNDGIVADTRSSTDDSEQFLLDVKQWLSKEHGLSVPEDFTRVFLSQLTVHMEKKLSVLHPALLQLEERLSSVPSVHGDKPGFSVGSITWLPNDMGRPGAPGHFRIEYKANQPFAKNYYFSQAPLQTTEHLALLMDFEDMLK